LEDGGHSSRECEDWTVYFRRVKYDNWEANATACNVSEAKTALQYVAKCQTERNIGSVRHVAIG
jgi:hypothetical protein